MSLKKFYMGKAIGFLTLVILVLGGYIIYKHTKASAPVAQTPDTQIPANTPLVSIANQDIKEENFSGSTVVISGTDKLAVAARNYVENTVSDFRKSANEEVPDLRKQFGEDNPTANYSLNVGAKYLPGEKTESVVIDVYTYTGGAHGSSLYKVFTADAKSGNLLKLSDVIKTDKQAAFTALVKKELIAWRPEGSTDSVVFPDTVADLTFADFENWSLDDKNITIYFDQYAVGPGVLGSTPFPIAVSKIQDFLK